MYKRVWFFLLGFCFHLPAQAEWIGWRGANGGDSSANYVEITYDDAGSNIFPTTIAQGPYYKTEKAFFSDPNLTTYLDETIVGQDPNSGAHVGVTTFFVSAARTLSPYKLTNRLGPGTGLKQDAQGALFDGPATMQVYGRNLWSNRLTGANVTHTVGNFRVSGNVSPGGRVAIIKTWRSVASGCYDQTFNEVAWERDIEGPFNLELVLPASSTHRCLGGGSIRNTSYTFYTTKFMAEDGDPATGSFSEIRLVNGATSGSNDFVGIDIQPNDDENYVETEGGFSDKMHVAILGSQDLDISQIDSATVTFGPATVSPHILPGDIVDTNSDGYDDLKLRFRTGATGISCEYPDLVELNAQMASGENLFGSDYVTTPDCPGSGCHP